MSLHDEKPRLPGDPEPAPEPETGNQNPQVMPEIRSAEPLPNWGSEPAVQLPATEVAPYPPAKTYPEDLQISWSWPHLILFVVFGFCSLLIIQTVLAVAYAPKQRLNTKQLEEYLISKPQFAVGSMLIWYATIFFFLYVTLSLLRGHPFWRTLGWRKLVPASPRIPRNPLAYFFAGSGLSFLVALMTSSMKAPDNTPMEELFKYPHTAMMFVAMAVFVAPLVEETLFRGYLYPTLVRIISGVVHFVVADIARAIRLSVPAAVIIMAIDFGVRRKGLAALTSGALFLFGLIGIIILIDLLIGKDSASADRASILFSIIFTGTLFGLMHGAQLGWTPGLVAMLTVVGIVFTLVRARTGTVFASFMMHLGYNLLISLATGLSTHWFTKMPTGK